MHFIFYLDLFPVSRNMFKATGHVPCVTLEKVRRQKGVLLIVKIKKTLPNKSYIRDKVLVFSNSMLTRLNLIGILGLH